MLSDTRRLLPGRIVLGTLAAGAALTLTACGPLPLLPPALSGEEESPSPEPEPEPTDEETEEPEPEPTEEPEPEPTEPESLDPEDTDVFNLQVGDCLNEMDYTDDDTISEVPLIDCDEPHDYEVYHVTDLEGGDDYPGEEEVAEMAADECFDEFEGFVGVDHNESSLDTTSLFPVEEGWEMGDDREVLCMVFDPAGQTTGSLEDARF